MTLITATVSQHGLGPRHYSRCIMDYGGTVTAFNLRFGNWGPLGTIAREYRCQAGRPTCSQGAALPPGVDRERECCLPHSHTSAGGVFLFAPSSSLYKYSSFPSVFCHFIFISCLGFSAFILPSLQNCPDSFLFVVDLTQVPVRCHFLQVSVPPTVGVSQVKLPFMVSIPCLH